MTLKRSTSSDMISDPILLELWIVALCSLVNAAPARVPRETCAAIATWEWSRRPRA